MGQNYRNKMLAHGGGVRPMLLFEGKQLYMKASVSVPHQFDYLSPYPTDSILHVYGNHLKYVKTEEGCVPQMLVNMYK